MADGIRTEFVEAGLDLAEKCLTVPGGWVPGRASCEEFSEQLEAATAAADVWVNELFERIRHLRPEERFGAVRWAIEGMACKCASSALDAQWRQAPHDN